jgi:hypothetical protein
MGRTLNINFNSVTHHQEIIHPFLDIGSSHSGVKAHILEWLTEQYGDKCSVGFDGVDYFIDFPTEPDLTMFLLRWS